MGLGSAAEDPSGRADRRDAGECNGRTEDVQDTRRLAWRLRRAVMAVFDTPMDVCVFNGFGGVRGCRGCVVAWVRVS